MHENRAVQITFFLLRVIVGLMFLDHGGMKLFGWFGGLPGSNGAAVPLLGQMGIAGIVEFFGGLLVVLGLFTRPAAFIMAGEMAVAYFHVHAPKGFWPIVNQGELAVLYCFIWLFVAAHGGGEWSIDALIRSRRPKPLKV